MEKKNAEKLKSPMINNTMPHQISAPNYNNSNVKPEEPFVNKHGVVIGDSHYNSSNSPLNHWSTDTDPSMMAGNEWVHPTNDIGWNTEENIELIEDKIKPKGAPFMHSTKDVSYRTD